MSSDKAAEVIYADPSKMSQPAEFAVFVLLG